jgi:N6-adenosine-specific RNA methylase IME4
MDQEQLKKYNELEKLIDKAMAHSRWPDERLEDMVEKFMGKMARLENGERPHEIN